MGWHPLLATTVAHLPHTHNLGGGGERGVKRGEEKRGREREREIAHCAFPCCEESGVIGNSSTEYPALMQTLKHRDDLITGKPREISDQSNLKTSQPQAHLVSVHGSDPSTVVRESPDEVIPVVGPGQEYLVLVHSHGEPGLRRTHDLLHLDRDGCGQGKERGRLETFTCPD